MSNSKGFTLVEILIATFLLSALLFTGSYTYQLFSERWTKDIGEFNESIYDLKGIANLESVLDGLIPWVVFDETVGYKKPVFMFVGSTTTLLAVTKNGLFSDEYPEIFRLSIKSNSNGKYSVFYQSKSTKNILFKNISQEIIFDNQVELLNNLNDFSIEYQGFEHYLKMSGDDLSYDPKLSETFSGLNTQLMPTKINIKIKKEEKELVSSFLYDKDSFRLIEEYLTNED